MNRDPLTQTRRNHIDQASLINGANTKNRNTVVVSQSVGRSILNVDWLARRPTQVNAMQTV